MGTRIDRSALTIVVCLLSLGCDQEPPADDGVQPTLSSIQDDLFTPRCTQSSCHSVEFHAGELVLVEGMAFAELAQPVNHPTALADGIQQVVAGDPEASFLWIKLQAGLDPSFGTLMPQGSSTGLPPEDIDAVRTWIERGADND